MPGGSRKADERTDTYQLGKTLYELIVGESPALMDPDRLPSGLAYVVERATRERPEQRYGHVGQLMDAVENYKLSKDPQANPSQAFEAAIREAEELAERKRYKTSNLETIVTLALNFAGDHNEIVDAVEQIPKRVLGQLARKVPNQLQRVLEVYCDAVDEVIVGYGFAYAEEVAANMSVVFDATNDPRVKALAVRATLVAAVNLNRYAAMDTFDDMLTALQVDNEILAVADVLRENLAKYRRVADRIPTSKLHVVLRKVCKEALRED